MNTTLIIIGSHPRTRADFDFERRDCDIWMFNEALSKKENTWAKRATAIFQMHIPTIWKNPGNRNDAGHFDWLKNNKDIEIWMQDEYPEVPMSKKYPLDGILAMLKGDPDHFLSSSVPQAMALAAYLGIYTRIEIYGVAMETDTEWHFQREGVAFWKGFLMGRGIDVFFADPTFRCPIYGYEGDVVLKDDRFSARIEELKPQIEKLSAEYTAALVVCDKAVNNLIHGDNSDEVRAAVRALCDKGQALGFLDGARQENNRYIKRAEAMKTATQDFAFSRQEFESAFGNLSKQYIQAIDQVNVLGGQLQLIHENIIRAAKESPKRAKLLDAYKALALRYFNMNNQAAIYQGAAQENKNYMDWLTKHIRAAGGEKSEAVILESMQVA